jgi:hypothetical protein
MNAAGTKLPVAEPNDKLQSSVLFQYFKSLLLLMGAA